jgi:hypothetical protein
MAEYDTPGAPGLPGPPGPPGPAGGTQINYWFHDDPSSIATYFQILDVPANGSESDDSVSVVAADGEKLIEAYATNAGVPGVTSIPAGNWTFSPYMYASVLGVAQVVLRIYKRDVANVETLLFFVTSTNILSSTATPQIINYASPAIALAATDRIVVKVFAKTSVAFATVVHFVHDGVYHASWFSTPSTPSGGGGSSTYVYGPNMDFTITLAGLSDNSSTKVIGRQSDAIDLSTFSYQDVIFSCKLSSSAALATVAGNSLEVWWVPQRTDGTWPDTFGAVDASRTVSSREELFAYGAPIGNVIVGTGLSHAYDIESSLIKATGQRRFHKIGCIWVMNASGQALDATAANHKCSWMGVT